MMVWLVTINSNSIQHVLPWQQPPTLINHLRILFGVTIILTTNIFCVDRVDVGNLINKDNLPIERVNGNGPSVDVGPLQCYGKYGFIFIPGLNP